MARHGANVALTYRRAADQAGEVVQRIEAPGRRGLAIAADSADPDAVVGSVNRAADELGRLDIFEDRSVAQEPLSIEEVRCPCRHAVEAWGRLTECATDSERSPS